ncbi:hypothetical protein BDV93DRAFT_526520 [Ceratobasidium sp. AG-I]|nr:hypothetical protein BDV93DRAFT_526520 [Ceratobasidium sp. AG-I]
MRVTHSKHRKKTWGIGSAFVMSITLSTVNGGARHTIIDLRGKNNLNHYYQAPLLL